MSRPVLDILCDLDRIICYDEADGCGNAEPYLWTAFFRLGGDDVSIVFEGLDPSTNPPKPIVHFEGSPFVQYGSGSHGNLGTRDVDAGDTVIIPEAVGNFETRLKPIAIPEDLKELGQKNGIPIPDDLPGFVGVVVVLMEEDNVTDDGAQAGHAALNTAIFNALQQAIKTRSYEHPGISDEEIAAFTKGITNAVEDAIYTQENIFENLWSWLNPDDQIGQKVWLFKTDDLWYKTSVPLQVRWHNEGDWELKGGIIPTLVCPADALATAIQASQSSPPEDTETFTYDRDSLIYFRDHEFNQYPGAHRWWEHIRTNKAHLIYLLLKDAHIRALTTNFFMSVQRLAKSPDEKIANADIDKAIAIAEALSKSKNRRTRVEAIRVIDFIQRCKGKTLRQILNVMNIHSPTRYHRNHE